MAPVMTNCSLKVACSSAATGIMKTRKAQGKRASRATWRPQRKSMAPKTRNGHRDDGDAGLEAADAAMTKQRTPKATQKRPHSTALWARPRSRSRWMPDEARWRRGGRSGRGIARRLFSVPRAATAHSSVVWAPLTQMRTKKKKQTTRRQSSPRGARPGAGFAAAQRRAGSRLRRGRAARRRAGRWQDMAADCRTSGCNAAGKVLGSNTSALFRILRRSVRLNLTAPAIPRFNVLGVSVSAMNLRIATRGDARGRARTAKGIHLRDGRARRDRGAG